MTRNAAAYRDTVRKREILTAELDRRNREIATAVEQARAAGKVPADLLLDLLANDDRADLQARIAATENQIHKLLNDPDKLIPVPDSWSEEQLCAEVEAFEPAITSTPTRLRPRAQRQPKPIRDWVTIVELARLFGVSYPTAARWARGEHLPHPDGDPRNPWQRDSIPVDISLGERSRRIWTGGINPPAIRTDIQQSRLAEILAQPPKGWTKKRVNAPLTLPEPHMFRRAAADSRPENGSGR